MIAGAGREFGASILSPDKESDHMDYETPEVLASYSEEELTEDAAVAMFYGQNGNDIPS